MVTQYPGFQDPVQDAQRTFRALLHALAQPGQVQTLTCGMQLPSELALASAAACLTLLDFETALWLQSGWSEAVKQWLLFHTGCRFTADPAAADFALIRDLQTLPSLEVFAWGTAELPEASTTLLVQLEGLGGGAEIELEGPGLLQPQTISLPLPQQFWQTWRLNGDRYPLGIDVYCFACNQIVGLPRTVRQRQAQASLMQL